MATTEMAPVSAESAPKSLPSQASFLASGPVLVLYIAAAKLLLHLFTASRYGIFRDEMYYLACGLRPAWGYVDHPPMTVWIGWFARHVFGESPLAIRLLPALAGTALVWLTGKLAREMGGGRFAQALAALAVLVVPIYLTLQHWLNNNAFEPLLWMACIWCLLRVIQCDDPRYWLWFGVLAGLSFETKYSIAFLLIGVLVGILLTPERRFLKNRYLWLGILACAVIALPNFFWQATNHFPFLELMHKVRMSGRDIVRGPVAFIVDQALLMNPALFPLWLGGLAWLFLAREGRRFRLLGWVFVVTLALFIALKGKNYYVTPIYPMLFAAGAVGLERVTSNRLRWTRAVYVGLALMIGGLLAPLACPILPVEAAIRYQKKLGIAPPASEHQNNGPLPQWFADEFGWEEMVREVARVYHSLPPEEQARTAIFSNSWGEAAAVDFYGPRYGLPRAISAHNTYWVWGPGSYTGEIMIILRSSGRGDREHFKSVADVGVVQHPYSRRDEWFHIFLCRGLKWQLKDVWKDIKHFD